MGKKGSLQVYRENVGDRRVRRMVYDNSRGSGLLADARAGMLDLNVLKSRYMKVDEKCRVCGEEKETIKNVVVDCRGLGESREVTVVEALGLGSDSEKNVEITKTRLCRWEMLA